MQLGDALYRQQKRCAMSIHLDLSVFDSGGQLAAVVEVKAQRWKSPEWAAEFRRNLLAHGWETRPRFFLIVTLDRIFIWKDAGIDPEIVPPDYIVDAHPVFEPYFEAARLDADQIDPFSFEMIVASWLNNLALVRDPAAELPSHEHVFIESGFLDAIRRGNVEHEVAV
jgi:hypothetical protein